MTDSQRQLASAIGRIPSGLFILTVKCGDAETGMLASWVQQCAFEPPHITIVIKRDRPINQWLTNGSRLTLNILDHTQTDMVAHFGRGFSLDQPAFEGLEVDRPGGGAPVLHEALAYLECRVVGKYAVGDHDLYVNEVVAGRLLSDSQPMVHLRKSGGHY